MMLPEIWKTFNTSYLLVLPIYSRILKNNSYIRDKKIKIPFLQVCIEMGLIQTYLEDTLILVFDKAKVMEKTLIVDTNATSFSEVLISSEYFEEIIFINKKVIGYRLKIPTQYEIDVRLIKNSKYSKVSKEYKSELLVTQNKIQRLESELGNKIISYNIPYGIVSRSKHIANSIRKIFTVPGTGVDAKVPTDIELFPKFNIEKETFNKKQYASYT